MPTSLPTTYPTSIDPGVGLLLVAAVGVLVFLAIVVRTRRPVSRAVPVVQTPQGAAAVVAVVVDSVNKPGSVEDAIAQGDAAMGNLATSWKAIKSSYNAVLDRAKTAELDRDHFKTAAEQANARASDLQRQLDAALAVAGQFDPGDMTAVQEIIASGSPKTPGATTTPAAPPATEPVETTKDNTGGD